MKRNGNLPRRTGELLQEEEVLFTPQKETPPDNWKMGRDVGIQLSKVERTLFSSLEEAESRNVIISGISSKVSKNDFEAFSFAAAQILYNQSYQSCNEDVNSGISRSRANNISSKIGKEVFGGEIVPTLNDLIRYGYGSEPTSELKKRMDTLIETLHKNEVKIKFPNGDEVEAFLCARMGKYKRKADGAVAYHLFLNPIFGSRIATQFGELPQDIMLKLAQSCKKKKQKLSPEHRSLLRWLSLQDKRYPHTLNIGTIIQELDMEEYYQKDKGKVERQLLSICETMVDLTLLSSYEVERTDVKGRQRISKITFHLNPNFIRPSKEIEAKPQEK